MEQRARIAGYTTVLALLIFMGWIGSAFIREALHPNRMIQVRFPQVGTLKTQDPVVQNGVPIGQVKSLKLQNGLAVAEIELYNHDFIPSDSRFVDFNHSLMGARLVVLRPGRSTLPMDENQVQQGFFTDGIAERIHHINRLLGQIANLRSETNQLFVGSGAPFSPEVFGRLEKDVAELNHLTNQVDQAAGALHSGLQEWIHIGNSAQVRFKSVSQMDTAERRIELTLKAALSAEQNADSLLTSTERMLSLVQDSSGTLRTMLYNHKVYDDLESSLRFLQTAVNVLQKKGLADAVKWRNLHFFKSNPQ